MKKKRLTRETVKAFLEERLASLGMSLSKEEHFDHYDRFTFTMVLPERSALIEIEFMEKSEFGFNLIIHRGDKLKALTYDTRFNMAFAEMVLELKSFIKYGE